MYLLAILTIVLATAAVGNYQLVRHEIKLSILLFDGAKLLVGLCIWAMAFGAFCFMVYHDIMLGTQTPFKPYFALVIIMFLSMLLVRAPLSRFIGVDIFK